MTRSSEDKKAPAAPAAPASLTSASLITAGANLVSRLFGFGREAYIAALFGTGAQFDLFVIASAVPDYLIAILLTALPVVIIPVSRTYQQQGGKRDDLFRIGTAIMGMLLALVCLLLWLCRVPLLQLMDSSLTGESLTQAAGLLSLLSAYLWFHGMEAWFRSWLYEQKQFWIPASSSIVLNIAVISTLALQADPGGIRSLGFAWLVCGIVLFLYSGIAALRTIRPEGGRPAAPHPVTGLLLTSLAAVVLVEALALVFPLIDRLFVSVLPDGQIAGLRYATFLVHIPTGIIAVTYATASFPWLAASAAESDMAHEAFLPGDQRETGDRQSHMETDEHQDTKGTRLRQLYGDSLRMLLFVSTFVAVLVCALTPELVSLAFMRGAFDAQSLRLTSEPLFWMTLGMPAYCLSFFLMRVYYAMRLRKRLGLVLIVMLATKLVLSLALVGQLTHRGLAIATAVSWVCCCAVMLVDTARLTRYSLGQLPLFLTRLTITAAITAAAIYGLVLVWPSAAEAGFWPIAFRTGGAGMVAIVLYLGAGKLAGLTEPGRLILLGRKKIA